MKRLSKREVGQQKRLHEQLDFFGAKKKRFVSIYASKPRIRVRNGIVDKLEINQRTRDLMDSSNDALCRNLALRAGVGSGFSFTSGLMQGANIASQTAALGQQQAMNSAMQMQGMAGSSLGMGSQFGWSNPFALQ